MTCNVQYVSYLFIFSFCSPLNLLDLTHCFLLGQWDINSIYFIACARTIKESIYIRVNNPTLNRNIGKLNLHHIWDSAFLNTSGLKIKRHVQGIGQIPNLTPLHQ